MKMKDLPSPLTIAWCKKNKEVIQEMNAAYMPVLGTNLSPDVLSSFGQRLVWSKYSYGWNR